MPLQPLQKIVNIRHMPPPTPPRFHPSRVECGRDRPQAVRTGRPDVRHRRREVHRVPVRICHNGLPKRHSAFPSRLIASGPSGFPNSKIKSKHTLKLRPNLAPRTKAKGPCKTGPFG